MATALDASTRQHPPRSVPGLRAPVANDLPVYLAALLGYLMLLPPQLNLSIGGSVIPPFRFFLIASALYLLGTVFRRSFRFSWPDIFIIASVGWICLAFSMTSVWQEAMTGSIAHIADIGFAYFFGRMAFRDLRDLRMFLILILPGLLLVGIVMMLESITQTHIIQELASQLTGGSINYRSDPRLGLMRAQGPFPHPILAGIFFSSFLPLYWLAGFKGWIRIAGALAGAMSFFTVSSATLLSLTAAGALLGYNWLTERIANLTWKLFFFFSALFVFVAELGTNSGTFSLFVRFASLNSNSAYNRINIWNYGKLNVSENPWFGIGYADWDAPAWMGTSIDNYWLLTAVRFGLPAATLIGIATLLAIVMIARKSGTMQNADQRCARGLAITLGVMALGLISVSAWLSAQVWYFLLLGLIVTIASAPRQPATAPFRMAGPRG